MGAFNVLFSGRGFLRSAGKGLLGFPVFASSSSSTRVLGQYGPMNGPFDVNAALCSANRAALVP
jgi:hypothetical protein